MLRGNLAPDGAIIKPAAASPELLQHRGRAVVFDSIEDFRARIDDPDLDVDADVGPRAARLRPARLPRHARGRQPAAAEEAARAGRARHGPRLRWPDERHGIRHGRAPRRARGRGRRPTGPRPDRRLDRARRAGPTPRLDVPGRRSWRRASGAQPAAAAPTPSRRVAGRSSTSTTSCRPTPAPTWTSWSDRPDQRSGANLTEQAS